MSDPISRADAIEAKPEYRNEDMLDKEKSTYNKGWNDCNDAWVAIIKALPSADAVEYESTVTLNSPISIQAEMVAVVRCKDCRYYKCGVDLCESLGDDGFCSWGERKGGE